MSDDRMTPTPVRFPADLTARIDAISKSMALSHAAVMRLAINQWFEAGGDKSLLSAPAKKSAKKAAPKGRGKQGK
jgi:predicted DNA-binding protein